MARKANRGPRIYIDRPRIEKPIDVCLKYARQRTYTEGNGKYCPQSGHKLKYDSFTKAQDCIMELWYKFSILQRAYPCEFSTGRHPHYHLTKSRILFNRCDDRPREHVLHDGTRVMVYCGPRAHLPLRPPN